MKKPHWHLGFVALFCAAITILFVAVPWQSSADSGQNVHPRGGGPNDWFAFYATGFKKGERVGYWATSPSGKIHPSNKEVIANKDGRADWHWKAPSSAEAGAWLIAAQGKDSNTLRTFRIEITTSTSGSDNQTDQNPVGNEYEGQNVSPRGGGPNDWFAFYATGFRKGERVGYWATSPSGKVHPSNKEVIANKDGRADWYWKAPSTAEAGTWLIAAQGKNSGTLRTLRVEIITGSQAADPQPTATPQPVGESQNVNPREGSFGTRFDFFATGFQAGEAVGYWATAPSGAVLASNNEVYANENGRVDWQWVAPNDIEVGAWSIVAQGKTSGTLRSLQIQIIAPAATAVPTAEPTAVPPAEPTAVPTSEPPSNPDNGQNVSPRFGSIGTVFNFYATGFKAGESVGYWATSPSGVTVPSNQEVIANSDGRADWSWSSPIDAESGTWLIVAQGKESGALRTLQIEIGN